MGLIKGFYINLDNRSDRKPHFEEIKQKHTFFKAVQRVAAGGGHRGGRGCCSSHIAAIQKCKELDGDVFMICEDDLIIFNEQHFDSMVNTLDITADWDVLTLTPRGASMLNEDFPDK